MAVSGIIGLKVSKCLKKERIAGREGCQDGLNETREHML